MTPERVWAVANGIGRMSATYVAAGRSRRRSTPAPPARAPIAGGTDLVVGARSGAKPMPDALVAIHALDELRALAAGPDGLRAGALVSHAALVADAGVAERYPALADASAIVGSRATRAQGTLGGNVMNASPAMDTGGPLLCSAAASPCAPPAAGRARSRSTRCGPAPARRPPRRASC